MLTEVPPEEFIAALDHCIDQVLWEAGIGGPPVDAYHVASRLDLHVVYDANMACRGRLVRLERSTGHCDGFGTIVVASEDRPERLQWAIAHEIGESVAHRVFSAFGVSVQEAAERTRELVANQFATCLLLPRRWFTAIGRAAEWDLLALKQRFATASHELIARRMLDMPPSVIISVCDHGRIHWRRANCCGPRVPMFPPEAAVWKQVHETGQVAGGRAELTQDRFADVRCWPVHEPGWRREILRSEIASLDEFN